MSWTFRGILALVCDGAATAPVPIPDFESSDNKTQRIVRATLSPEGTLDADETTTYSGVAAQRWRARFEDASEESRISLVRDDLRRTVAGIGEQSLPWLAREICRVVSLVHLVSPALHRRAPA